MSRRTTKFACFLLACLFLISLVPLQSTSTLSDVNVAHGLTSLIVQVQQLRQSSESTENNFQQVFDDTITAFQSLAGIKVVYASRADQPNDEQKELIVHIKIPYVTNNGCITNSVTISTSTYPINLLNTFSSHSFPPETPPPDVS